MSEEGEGKPSEVRAYLRRLLLLIGLGLLLMITAAVWAWHTYGKRLETAPPLPADTPPVSTAPASPSPPPSSDPLSCL